MERKGFTGNTGSGGSIFLHLSSHNKTLLCDSTLLTERNKWKMVNNKRKKESQQQRVARKKKNQK